MGILSRLKEIQELPTLPEVVLRVQALANSDSASADELARAVSEDPSLAAKLLKVANSAYFGGAQHISSIKTAVARIGFNEVRNITMAVGLIRQFSRKSTLLDYGAFWRHSLAAGFLSQKIVASMPGLFNDLEREQVFMSGLLHDIGILVLDQFFHAEFKTLIDRAAESETSFISAEREVLASESHAVVGATLLEFWRIDPVIHLALRYHHDPARCPEQARRQATVAAIAEYILCSRQLGSFVGTLPPPDAESLALLGYTADGLAGLNALADTGTEKADAVLSVSQESGLRSV
jgi:HD-like signal output (HDOD) protein